jgi:hypothetical protein
LPSEERARAPRRAQREKGCISSCFFFVFREAMAILSKGLLELLVAGSLGIGVALYAFGEPLKQAAEVQAKRQRAAAAAAAAAAASAADAGRSGGAK